MRILMTGGTGFTGSAMLNYRRDYEVYVVTRQNIEDCGNVHYVHDVPDIGFTHVVHLEPCGVDRTLDIARIASRSSARLLFASSGAVYERLTDYGVKKAVEEVACMFSCADVVIARLYSFIGPKLTKGHSARDIIDDAVSGGPIVIHGTGQDVRSYLDSTDLAEWMWDILLRGQSGQAYNVGSEHPTTILDFANLVSSAFGGLRVDVLGSDVHGLGGSVYLPDTSRARSELGLSQRVGIEESISRMKVYYESI